MLLDLRVPDTTNSANMDSDKQVSKNVTATEMDDVGESEVVNEKYIGTEADRRDMWKLGRRQVVRVSRRQFDMIRDCVPQLTVFANSETSSCCPW